MLTLVAEELRVEELTTAGALDAVRSEWCRLWRRCPAATPFQSPAWCIAWWRHFGRGALWTLAVRRRDRLIALAPLFIGSNSGGERNVQIVGTGNTDWLDILAEPGHERSGMEAMVAHLGDHTDRWDTCDLQQLRANSPLASVAWPTSLETNRTIVNDCPVLALGRGLEQTVPASQWKKLAYYRRRAERTFSVRFERTGEENFDASLAALIRLHSSRWQARELPGVLEDGTARRFHRETAWTLLRHGLLRMSLLWFDRQIAACFYGFAAGRGVAYYLGGFDPRFRQYSPGLLVVGHAIEEAIGEGAEEFDFLRGREPYKYDWGAQDRMNLRLEVRHAAKVRGP